MNRLSRQVWVFLATCALWPGASAKLSPPTVDPPLLSCATTVSIGGLVPGATIGIFIGEGNRIGGGMSDSPWGQVFWVTPALSAGEPRTRRPHRHLGRILEEVKAWPLVNVECESGHGLKDAQA